MAASGWFPLLARNRFAVGWRYWYIAGFVSLMSFVNGGLGFVQWLLYRKRLRETEIVEQPIFIVGHWRSGTTLLHELLVQDERHTFPTTFQCFLPHHFLLTERRLSRWLRFLLPARRPMDNMPAGWDRPQEDEFALANLGVPSPYLTIAFPNRPPAFPEYLSLEQAPPRDRERWKASFLNLLRGITIRAPKRIVLKSPTHTARLRILLEMFPGARFVHIVRNPCVLFPSTLNLWRRLYEAHGLQSPTCEGLEEQVFATLLEMYERFEADRALAPPGQLCEVRYEELVSDPIGCMRRVYRELHLGELDAALPAMERYLEANKHYVTNRFDVPVEMQRKIEQRWFVYGRKYGYFDAPAQRGTHADESTFQSLGDSALVQRPR
jgi:omega-hydroxy-beta-dihydromenaquinone-9 sulfotransferase